MSAIAGAVDLPVTKEMIEKIGKSSCMNPWELQTWTEFPHGVFFQIGMNSHSPKTVFAKQGKYIVTYAGEVYNLKKIEDKLFPNMISPQTTDEILLEAFMNKGPEFVRELQGAFAIAIYSVQTGQLFLARDHLGMKPLYYLLTNQGILFGSHICSILAHPLCHPVLDAVGASELLLIGPGRVPGSGILKDIYQLKPGHYGIWENGVLRQTPYWKLTDDVHRDNLQETSAHIRELVTGSVSMQLQYHQQYGTMLSGGLDSGIISSICAGKLHQKGERLPTFTVEYQNHRNYFIPGKFQPSLDSDYTQETEDYCCASPHHIILNPDDLYSHLWDGVKARGYPGMADIDISLLLFCREIRKICPHVLSGECADELFGGYPWFRDPKIRQKSGFPWAQNTHIRNAFLKIPVNAEEYILNHYKNTISNCHIMENTEPLEQRMKEMMNLNLDWFMQTLLARNEAMSRYAGLSIGTPFCSWKLAEYLYRVPWELKEYGGYEKGLLRYSFTGQLPENILWRKKSPYPKTYDPHYLSLAANAMEELLSSENEPIWEIIKPVEARQLITREMSQPWYGQLMKQPQTLAYLLQINFWLKNFGIDIKIS